MDWLDITLIGFIAGTFGTSAGGLLSFIFLKPSNKILGIMLSIAAGVMLSIILWSCPAGISQQLCLYNSGITGGDYCLSGSRQSLPHKHFVTEEVRQGRYFKKGLLIATGIALHNISKASP